MIFKNQMVAQIEISEQIVTAFILELLAPIRLLQSTVKF